MTTTASEPAPPPLPTHMSELRQRVLQLANAGQLAAAVEECSRAQEAGWIDPDLEAFAVRLRFDQANAALGAGDPARAETLYRATLAADPRHVQALTNLGTALAILGRTAEAERAFNGAIRLDPQNVQAHANLGNLLTETGRAEDAVHSCRAALALDPSHVGALVNLGNARLVRGELSEAAAHLRQALDLDPTSREGHATLGVVLQRGGDLTGSESALRAALALDPDQPHVWRHLALTLQDLGRVDEAEEALREVLRLAPRDTAAITQLGSLAMIRGDQAGAERAFREALATAPDRTDALLGLATMGTLEPTDEVFESLHRILEQGAMSTGEEMLTHFALSRMEMRAGRHLDAFDHAQAAHRTRARHHGHVYDSEARDRERDDARTVFTPDFFEERSDWALDTRQPIFVVGMPRSGTSLIEQILASHSRVHGAGEVRALPTGLHDLLDRPGSHRGGVSLVSGATKLTRAELHALADEYLAATPSNGAHHVVDKMPHNFENLWAVALLFPRATVIHAVRSPLDTCISCFFQNFTRGHSYTDDLESLGHHYRYQHERMEHWKSVLPMPVHEVSYEGLVSDPEKGIRDLLSIAGLDFEAECLDFHATRRDVRTASLAQVRQRAYTTSIGRWRAYADRLEPLKAALGPELAAG